MHYSNLLKIISGTLLVVSLFNSVSIAQILPNATQADPKAGSVTLATGGSMIVERTTIKYQFQNGSSAAPNDNGVIPAGGATLTIGFPNEYSLEPNVVPIIPGFTVINYTAGAGGQLELTNNAALDAGEETYPDVPVVGFQTTTNNQVTTFTVGGSGPPVVSANTNTGNYISSGFIGVSQPLPVTLLSFKAGTDGCNAVLSWSTAKEDNFRHFEITYAKDGVYFVNVGKVFGGKRDYTFSYTQNSGEGFFKLNMVNCDGTFNASDVVIVFTSCSENKIDVYPNPASELIDIAGAVEGSTIYVVNMLGQILVTNNVRTASIQTIQMNSWAAGNYHVVVVNANKKDVTVVVKQ